MYDFLVKAIPELVRSDLSLLDKAGDEGIGALTNLKISLFNFVERLNGKSLGGYCYLLP